MLSGVRNWNVRLPRPVIDGSVVCLVSRTLGPSKSKSGSLSKSIAMGLGHEKLDVYRLSIGYVAWVYEKAGTIAKIQERIDSKTSISIPIAISISTRGATRRFTWTWYG